MAFKQVAKIEAHHRARFKKLLEMVEAGSVFKREHRIKWECSACIYIHEGTEPLKKYHSYKHPQRFYEPANLDL